MGGGREGREGGRSTGACEFSRLINVLLKRVASQRYEEEDEGGGGEGGGGVGGNRARGGDFLTSSSLHVLRGVMCRVHLFYLAYLVYD